MSYDIYLRDGGMIVEVPIHSEGGTYVCGGTTDGRLNLTYNYSPHYREHIDAEEGIRWLYGRTGKETIEKLESAVAVLGIDRDDDYWAPTRGNAGYALSILLGWARAHPDAVWSGD